MRNAHNVAGRQAPMDTQLSGGNRLLVPTQLIQWHADHPTQYIVTLSQIGKDAQHVPWTIPAPSFEGGTSYANLDVPTIPSGNDSLMCDVRFGVAGVSTRVLFDYPSAGGSFGITADAIELTVRTRATPSTTNIIDVPRVGAMLVEGVATSSELTWTEIPRAIAANTARYWTVKPFAKALRISASNLVGTESVLFIGGPPASPTMWRQFVPAAGGAAVMELPVPAGAVVVQFLNGANAVTPYLQWVVELS